MAGAQGTAGRVQVPQGHPAGPFTADFYCHEARLVIEVDGEAHGRGDRPARDARRDEWFAEREIGTMRVTARDVLDDLDGVVAGVVARAAGGDAPPPTGPRGPAVLLPASRGNQRGDTP